MSAAEVEKEPLTIPDTGLISPVGDFLLHLCGRPEAENSKVGILN